MQKFLFFLIDRAKNIDRGCEITILVVYRSRVGNSADVNLQGKFCMRER